MKKQKGFTLVEIILYMALLSIFLIVLTDIFVSILDVRRESEATSAVEQDGRYILNRFMYDIPRASSVTTPASLGGSGSTLAIVIGGTNYTYSLSGGNLQLNDGTINNLNSSGTSLSDISFQRIGNSGGKDTIKIQFTLTSVTTRPKGSEVRTFQTTVGRR